MKIKINDFIEEISSLDNNLFMDEARNPSERLLVTLKSAKYGVSELANLINANKSYDIIITEEGGTEDIFSNYQLENIRKSFSGTGKQIIIEFYKIRN